MMVNRRTALVGDAALVNARSMHGQDFPTKPIKTIVPSPPAAPRADMLVPISRV